MNPVRLFTSVCAAMALLAALPGHAAVAIAPVPFVNGKPELGKVINDRDCVDCHARRFDGKPDQIYLRANRRVHTRAQLLAQVAYCSAQLGTGYFPDEEEHIAAYLNKQYYRFE